MEDFKKELCSLLNRHSKESDSDTPDFILAEYLIGSLKVFCESVNHRNTFYVRMEGTPSPTGDRDCEELKKEVEILKELIAKWENEAKEAWRKIQIYKDESDRYKKA